MNGQEVPTAGLEQVEAETMFVLETGAPKSARTALGIRTTRTSGGVALAMRQDVTGYWNKALGFGFSEAVSARTIQKILDFYREQGASGATLQIAPDALPTNWPDICTTHGLVAEPGWAKLAGDVDEVLDLTSDLVRERPGIAAGPIARKEADEWGTVTVQGFGMPLDHYAAMTANFAGAPGVVPLAARDGERIVGAASLRVEGPVGHLFACAVLPEARRLGGQTALLHARAVAARRHGCRWLVAETAAGCHGQDVPSLRNMLRAGMQVRYERANWCWRADGTHG